jgi:predicted nucleotidyltransferase
MFQGLLAKIAAELDRVGIAYMIIGGQAVLLYGDPRLTKDIDITLGVGIEGMHTIEEVARVIPLALLVDDPASFVRETMVLPTRDETTGIRVDFIFSSSEYERQALERAVNVDLGEVSVRFASLEDLVIHKIVAGRERDMEDVRRMLLKHPDCDSQYVESWLNEFDKSLHEDFSETFRNLLKTLK